MTAKHQVSKTAFCTSTTEVLTYCGCRKHKKDRLGEGKDFSLRD